MTTTSPDPEPFEIEMAALSDAGTERGHNEDHCGKYIKSKTSGLVAVADGMATMQAEAQGGDGRAKRGRRPPFPEESSRRKPAEAERSERGGRVAGRGRSRATAFCNLTRMVMVAEPRPRNGKKFVKCN
jgi:hypothetical protein